MLLALDIGFYNRKWQPWYDLERLLVVAGARRGGPLFRVRVPQPHSWVLLDVGGDLRSVPMPNEPKLD